MENTTSKSILGLGLILVSGILLLSFLSFRDSEANKDFRCYASTSIECAR